MEKEYFKDLSELTAYFNAGGKIGCAEWSDNKYLYTDGEDVFDEKDNEVLVDSIAPIPHSTRWYRWKDSTKAL